jgi:hypothetical protein
MRQWLYHTSTNFFTIQFNSTMAANYYDSALVKYQGKVLPQYNEAELRELNTETLAVGLQNQKYINVDVDSIKESTIRPVSGYQFVRKPSTNGTAMTAFNTGIQSASAEVPLNWVCFTEEFFTYGVTGFDNVEKYTDIYYNELSQAQRNLRERLRVYIMQNLYASRSSYNAGGIKNATFNASNSCWELSNATRPFGDIASVMRQNKYGYSGYDMFCDSALYPLYQYQIAQGVGNAVNTSYQFNKTSVAPGMGGMFNNVWEDITLGNEVPIEAAYTNGTAIVMPKYSFAFIPWMPKIYRDGGGDFESYSGGYGVVGDSMFPNMEYMVHGWKTQQDTSANHGYTQDTVLQWQIGIYVAFQKAVMSNAGESPIYQFALTA